MSWSYFNYSKINKKCYTKINTITSAKLAVTVGLLSLCILLFSRRYFSMSVCVSVRLPFAWHTVLSSYFTLSLSRSLILSFHGLLGRLGFSSFFSFKKTEIEIFFNSCKVKNSSIWWCVVGGGGIGDIRPPFCWGLHKIKGVCVCLFFSLSLHFTFWDA